MKIKALAIGLTCLLWAGCGTGGQDESPELNAMTAQKSTVESSVEESVEIAESKAPESETTEPNTSESDVAESEEPAYVLTFEATTTEGDSMTSDCFADSRLTMLNIWGTYCNPCLMEMPDLGEIAASYDKSEFQMIGIVCDVTEDADAADIDNAKALIEETGANYTHLLLSESLYTNLVGSVDAVPTTFFVNQKGEVLGYVVGANAKETWVELIESLLAEME